MHYFKMPVPSYMCQLFCVWLGSEAGQQAVSVSQFVGASLESIARAPLGDAGMTLAQAIDLPSAELRLQAGRLLQQRFLTGDCFMHLTYCC